MFPTRCSCIERCIVFFLFASGTRRKSRKRTNMRRMIRKSGMISTEAEKINTRVGMTRRNTRSRSIERKTGKRKRESGRRIGVDETRGIGRKRIYPNVYIVDKCSVIFKIYFVIKRSNYEAVFNFPFKKKMTTLQPKSVLVFIKDKNNKNRVSALS